MELKLKLILCELNADYETYLELEDVHGFERVAALNDLTGSVQDNCLIVCRVSELSAARAYGKHFLCPTKSEQDGMGENSDTSGAVMIKNETSEVLLYNRVLQIFLRIGSWIMKMQESVIANKGLQDLMDLSEPVLQNSISCLDSTLKLLAYTKNTRVDDRLAARQIKIGYCTPERINLLKSTGRFRQYANASDELLIDQDQAILEYTTVKKIFKDRTNSFFYAMIVMVCNGREVSDAVIELFKELLVYVRHYIYRDVYTKSVGGPFAALASDLLDKKSLSREEIQTRAISTGVTVDFDFVMYRMVLKENLSMTLHCIVNELSMLLSSKLVFAYKMDVIILNPYNGVNKYVPLKNEPIWDRFGQMIRCVGVSNPFHGLTEIVAAYEQSLAATKWGEVKYRKENKRSDSEHKTFRYHLFEDYYIPYMLDFCFARSLLNFSNHFGYYALDKILEYDKRHNTECFSLLRIYLYNERKATFVSEQMRIHRNTVLYHLDRIEQLLDLNLDDPEIRLKLILAYHAYDMGLWYQEQERNS